eukprot:8358318-Prorocentrum_lima.AAC.1
MPGDPPAASASAARGRTPVARGESPPLHGWFECLSVLLVHRILGFGCLRLQALHQPLVFD